MNEKAAMDGGVWGCPGLAWTGCVCARAVTTPPSSDLFFSPGDRRLRSQTTEAPMAFGHCCRRAGASGEEPDSELGDRKLILEEVNGSSNFFFFCLASCQGCRPE